MNAYAQLGSSDQSEALLDHVEKWYRETRDELSIAGNKDENRNKRVLVLHGQPGDGKTTFCKKAVYAHCFEGWLTDAPNVIRVSLNKSENLGIMKDGKVSLPTSISLKWNSRGEVLCCAPDKLQKGTLVIFDGYDELAGELAGDKEVSTFAGFYECVSEFAKDQGWFVVITSRTMCIRRELEEKKNVFGQVDSFAPLTTLRQEMMIDRMIELDNKNTDLRSYQEKEFPKLREKDELKEFLGIPILFRMIVAVRFKDANKAQTMAGLYGSLFNSLMDYRGKKADKANILKEYEDIAAGIFDYNDDTCPLNERMIAKNKELTYLFLTKSELDAKKKKGDKEEAVKAPERGRKVVKKEGQVGFLHRSFYQYFLARYLVSRIQGGDEGVGKVKFLEFMLSLRVRMIEEPLVWQFVYEISMLKGTEDDPFCEADDTEPVAIEDIKRVRKFLDNEMIFAECITGANETLPGSNAETKRWLAAENAIFNVTSALSAAENACRESGDKPDGYKGYENICRLLRRGYYHKIYLEKADFSDCNLVCANLAEAHMAGICLSGSKLKTANLIKADLKDSNLSGANLEGANLAGALLNDAHFEGADFTKADLSGADLTDAYFDWTKSEGEKKTLFDAEKLTTLREANLSGAKMVNTHFKEAELARAVLENADLSGACLEGANLTGAKLAGADLTGAKMAGADLAGADLRGACLIGAELSGAHMEETQLDRAVLKGAILTEAYLERASLIGAELVGADLTGTHLEGAVLKGAYLDALKQNPNEGLSVSAKDSAAVHDKAFFSGTDINGAYFSDEQYQYAKAHGALGQPYILTEGGNILFGGDSQKPSKIAPGMGGIVFGRYKQGKNGEVLPLRWRVLAVEYEEEKPKRALLITEKLIDSRRYHNEWKDITWAKCDLMKWLNEVFFFEAFSDEERGKIDLTRNANPPNMEYNIDGGKPTKDKVFLLSLGEAKKYFHSDRDRMAEVTKYAITHGSYFDEKGMGWWWLRSPGYRSLNAACVRPGGGVDGLGCYVYRVHVAVRPALWLNL